MKALLVVELPPGPGWLYELKLDGYRAQARIDAGHITLFSGRGNDLTGEFPQVVKAIKTVKAKTALLDGEIIAVDDKGRHSFQALQSRGAVKPGWHVVFYAFDLLHLEGESLLLLPH